MSKSQYDENQQLDSNVHTTLDEEALTEAQSLKRTCHETMLPCSNPASLTSTATRCKLFPTTKKQSLGLTITVSESEPMQTHPPMLGLAQVDRQPSEIPTATTIYICTLHETLEALTHTTKSQPQKNLKSESTTEPFCTSKAILIQVAMVAMVIIFPNTKYELIPNTPKQLSM